MSSTIILHQPIPEKVIKHSLDNSISTVQILQQKLIEKGFVFLQNQKIGNYNFNFYCSKHKIAIEIDGYAHEFSDVYSKDLPKKLHIHSLGIVVFRFTDYQVLTDIEEIIRAVKNHIKTSVEHPYVV
ncbi:DUF559 domain-containing protein [Aquimarina sp. MMG016]|uniref:endonuclease domain-containing protein n=1 Tax=Aquimarina sp. MMG016 TaxID=2822690 RepID=UPI001B39E3DB|nr:DUF559 domain-containing protein [Aquimarina sp. MMG016]MBQ4818538.1 DUF559 domain-containing protein [Aquimarina sp. MMG016]